MIFAKKTPLAKCIYRQGIWQLITLQNDDCEKDELRIGSPADLRFERQRGGRSILYYLLRLGCGYRPHHHRPAGSGSAACHRGHRDLHSTGRSRQRSDCLLDPRALEGGGQRGRPGAQHTPSTEPISETSFGYMTRATTEVKTEGTGRWIASHIQRRRGYRPPRRGRLRMELQHERKAIAGRYCQLLSGQVATGVYLHSPMRKIPSDGCWWCGRD